MASLPKVALAPMAGYTDRAMRLMAKEYGADFSVSEMISAKAVCFGDKKTNALARIMPDEGDVILQLFGSEPDTLARAASLMQNGISGGVYGKPVAIDINMGCPVAKIYSNGEGSALMKDPRLIERIVAAVSGNIDIPCTVKLRLGIDSSHINVIECAQAAESGGAAMITVHGRTRAQMYSGEADIEAIGQVKRALRIPVYGNGDVVNAESAINMLRSCACDGIMVGRGAVGNPFIFAEISAALRGDSYTPPTLGERIEAAKRQLMLAVMDKGEAVAIPESRKQIALYFKGFRGAAALRGKINSLTSYAQVARAIDETCAEGDFE